MSTTIAPPTLDLLVQQVVELARSDLRKAAEVGRRLMLGSDTAPVPDAIGREIGNDWHDLLAASASVAGRAQVVMQVATADARVVNLGGAGAPVAVAELLEAIKGRPAQKDPEPACIEGAFFPCVLLFDGWWQQRGSAAWGLAPTGAGTKSPAKAIQAWLNHGFQQWGPSISLVAPNAAEGDLFAQLGYGDEANSLPVIVAPGKAREARGLLADKLVIGARVQGSLCHRDHIVSHFTGGSQAIARQLLASEPQFEHFLLVEDDKPSHRVEETRALDFYSAYLWHCLVPSHLAERAANATLALNDTIFLWEHTNLFDTDSVKFNWDALLHKKAYLENVMRTPLRVIQHSYAVDRIVETDPVTPLVSTATMLDLFARARDRLSHD